MARQRQLSAPSSEPGPRISRTAIFVPTLLAQVRPIRRLSMDNLPTPLHESCPPSRWDEWGIPTKLLRRHCFWRRMTLASLQVSNCSLMAAEDKSDRASMQRVCLDKSCLQSATPKTKTTSKLASQI